MRWKAEGIYWSSRKTVDKASWKLVTLGHFAHSSVTAEECTGHSFPQNRRCSFGPSTLCTTIVSARTLFRRILCLFVVFLEVPFSGPALRPPVQSGQCCCLNSCLGSSWSNFKLALILSRWITDVYPPAGYLTAAAMIMWPSFWYSYFCIGTLSWPLAKICLFQSFYQYDWI